MTLPVSAERWLAIRALREGEPPTFERLAAASSLHPVTIRQRALTDSWAKRKLPRAGSRAAASAAALVDDEGFAEAEMSHDELRERLSAAMPKLLARLVRLAESGHVDKAQLDAMVSLTRLVERAGGIFGDDCGQGTRRSDDEIAGFLRQVDERIVELAHAHAARLGGEEPSGEMG